MKKLLIIFCFMLIVPLINMFAEKQKDYLGVIFFVKEYDWEPVYVNNMELEESNYLYIEGDEVVYYQKHLGFSYFNEINPKKFINKNLGYLVDELGKKYKFIDFAFSNDRSNDSNSHEVIYLYFRLSDNYIIEIRIFADNDNILKSIGNDRSLNALKKLSKYFATFIKIDLLKFYCQRRDMNPLLRKLNESKVTNLMDSISKASYNKIINAGIDYKCE